MPEHQNPDTKKKVMQRAPSPPLPSPLPPPHPQEPALNKIWERGHQFQSCGTDIDTAWQTVLKQIQDGIKLKQVRSDVHSDFSVNLKTFVLEEDFKKSPGRVVGPIQLAEYRVKYFLKISSSFKENLFLHKPFI